MLLILVFSLVVPVKNNLGMMDLNSYHPFWYWSNACVCLYLKANVSITVRSRTFN